MCQKAAKDHQTEHEADESADHDPVSKKAKVTDLDLDPDYGTCECCLQRLMKHYPCDCCGLRVRDDDPVRDAEFEVLSCVRSTLTSVW